MVLVSQQCLPCEVLELCNNRQLTAAMAALPASGTSQYAAMRCGMPLYTSQLQFK